MKEIGWIAIVGGVVLLEVATAPGQLSGQGWELKRSESSNRVQFTVKRWLHGSSWTNGNAVPLTDFRGFSLDMLNHAGPAKFEYVHDSGRLFCQGRFAWGRGSGTFTFNADPKFANELKRLGYDAPDDEQAFSMMMANVSLEFARAIQEAELNASTSQLIDLRNHGVSSDYVRAAQHAGYRNFTVRNYIDMRSHGVESDFLRDLKFYGYDLSARDIIDLRTHGVSAEFARELADAGYDLPANQIAELRMHGIDSGYMRNLKRYGLQPRASDLVQLRAHGVTPDYLKALKDAGYTGLAADEITDLRNHGVPAEFIQEARNLGYRFTPKDLQELRNHGVDGAYLKTLRESGIRDLTASQITQLRQHGVN